MVAGTVWGQVPLDTAGGHGCPGSQDAVGWPRQRWFFDPDAAVTGWETYATAGDYRIPGCFTSIPFSCIFSCSTFGLTSKAVARLMYSFVTK